MVTGRDNKKLNTALGSGSASRMPRTSGSQEQLRELLQALHERLEENKGQVELKTLREALFNSEDEGSR